MKVKSFEELLDHALDPKWIERNRELTMNIVDCVRSGDVPPESALVSIRKHFHINAAMGGGGSIHEDHQPSEGNDSGLSNRNVILYGTRDVKLTSLEAFEILRNADKKKFTVNAPIRPGGGEMYIYSCENKEEYRSDCYKWSSNTGFRGYPTVTNPIVMRKIKKIKTDEHPINGDGRFEVNLFKSLSGDGPLLVHYVGDSSIYRPMPHGNEKKNPTKDDFPTAASIRIAMKASTAKPHSVYQEMKMNPVVPNHPAHQPRNLKQVQNFRYATKQKNQLSHDALYGVYLLGFEFPTFVQEFRTEFGNENNLVFLVSRPLLERLNRLLKLPPALDKNLVEVYYDTTFQMGDFYLSTVSFRHDLLSLSPTIPCAFVLHQRKSFKDHAEFLRVVGTICPNLQRCKFAFITDREFKDVSAIFPHAYHYFCWNHIQSDVRFWANKGGHKSEEYRHKGQFGSYVADVQKLLRSETREVYEKTLVELKQNWAEGFLAYWKSLENDLKEKACVFTFAPRLLYDDWSGVTTNAAESMNAILKREVGTNVTMPEAILSLQYLTNYFNYEIDCGMCGTGKYPVAEWVPAKYRENLLDLCHRNAPIDPKDIVAFVKNQTTNISFLPPSEIKLTEAVLPEEHADDSTKAVLAAMKNATDAFDQTARKPTEKNNDRRPDRSQLALAKELCMRGNVSLCCNRKAFVVENTEGTKYAVTLFPKERCVCPAMNTCYHIIAARMSIGLTDTSVKGTKSMSYLCTRSRKKRDRGTARKVPKRKDYMANPAHVAVDADENISCVHSKEASQSRMDSTIDDVIRNVRKCKAPDLVTIQEGNENASSGQNQRSNKQYPRTSTPTPGDQVQDANANDAAAQPNSNSNEQDFNNQLSSFRAIEAIISDIEIQIKAASQRLEQIRQILPNHERNKAYAELTKQINYLEEQCV